MICAVYGMAEYSIFISSVQKELAEERQALKAYVEGDALLSRFFEVFLFEQLPAEDRRADQVYLDQVDQCDLYLGLFGDQYGYEDAAGVSPTAREFDRATERGKTRLIYVRGANDKGRHPKMAALIRRAGDQLIRRRFTTTPELIREVYASLAETLESRGMLQTMSFDDSLCSSATLKDIEGKAIEDFIETAEARGRLALKGSRAPKAVLQNFKLLRDGKLTNAAILLFGKDPRRFFNNIQVHCFHFFGTEKRKPIASQQPYEGRIFEVIDQAVEFVLGKLDRPVGTREHSTRAPGDFEIPRSVITEAIVNAVAHHDYRSNGFVQVIVFADRIEVWNPGELPRGLTPEKLREPHGPIPRNPLLAEPLYRVKLVEKAGTGTTDMIADCRIAGIPEPEFRQDGPHFVITVWRDWLTEAAMDELGLNERQKKGVAFIKHNGTITNRECQDLTGSIVRTATRDLKKLVNCGLFKQVGRTGRSTHYVLRRKQDMNRTQAPKGRA